MDLCAFLYHMAVLPDSTHGMCLYGHLNISKIGFRIWNCHFQGLYMNIFVYVFIYTYNQDHISLHGAGPGPGPGTV
jgi:hypothetical protein